jgi:hypothetical protein
VVVVVVVVVPAATAATAVMESVVPAIVGHEGKATTETHPRTTDSRAMDASGTGVGVHAPITAPLTIGPEYVNCIPAGGIPTIAAAVARPT